MPQSDGQIKAKVEARRLVKEALEMAFTDFLVGSGSGAYSDDRVIFWSEVRKFADAALPSTAPDQKSLPMTDQEARNFGNETMTFGVHEFKRISAVPLSYLQWLADQKDDFKDKVRRYLKSDIIQAEICAADSHGTGDRDDT